MTRPIKPELRRRVTVWGGPGSRVDTVRGVVRYEDWCNAEAARISAQGDPCRVVWNRRGECCVTMDHKREVVA